MEVRWADGSSTTSIYYVIHILRIMQWKCAKEVPVEMHQHNTMQF